MATFKICFGFVVVYFSFILLTVCMHRMEGRQEQRAVLKFLAKSGETPINSWRKLHDVFGDRTMSKGRVRVWHKNFLQGQERIKDGARSGRPRTAHSKDKKRQAGEFLETNRTVNLQDIVEHLDISVTSAHRLLKKDMNLSKLSPKFVPKELTQAQKDVRKGACERNLQRLKDDPTLLECLVTGDESWVSVYEVPTKRQSSQWLPRGTHGDCPQKALPQRSECKSMLTLFFDKKGVVLAEFAPRGQRINSGAYCETIKTLKERLRRKRPEL